MPYYIGDDVRVGVAIQAETSGMTYDGTPGTYDVMKLAPGGGFKYDPRENDSMVEEMDVDATDVVFGVKYYTGTVDVVMSYSYREKIFKLFMGGDVASSGEGPYDHVPALADKLLFGAIFVEHGDQAANANEFVRETFTNMVITAVSLKEAPEGYAGLTFSWVAVDFTRSDTVASLATVQSTEVVSWDHLTTTLDGSAYIVGPIGFDLGASMSEGEADHGATSLEGMFRKGGREVRFSAEVRMNTAGYALTATKGSLWDSENSFVWNNGESSTDEREFSTTFGDSFIEGNARQIGAFGRETRAMTLRAKDSADPRVLAVAFKNARTTIDPV